MSADQQELIDDCEARESRLTDWERKFLDSIQQQEFPLSFAQEDKLDEIWERVTANG